MQAGSVKGPNYRTLPTPDPPKIESNTVYMPHSGRLEVMHKFTLNLENKELEEAYRYEHHVSTRLYSQLMICFGLSLVIMYSVYSWYGLAKDDSSKVTNSTNTSAAAGESARLFTAQGTAVEELGLAQDAADSHHKDFVLNAVRLFMAFLALLFFVPWSLSRFYRRHHQTTIMMFSIIGSVVKAFAVTDTGVLAATLAPILWYFLLTLRLRNACLVAVLDFFIYNFYLLLGSGMSASDIAKNDIFVLSMEIVAFYAASQKELESRIDFLNQLAVSERKKLSSNLLDNILPKHVSSELVSEVCVCVCARAPPHTHTPRSACV